MSLLSRFRTWLNQADDDFVSSFYEPMRPTLRVRTEEGRLKVYPELDSRFYQTELFAQLRGALEDHHPGAKVIRTRVDLFTEQGGRRVARLQAIIRPARQSALANKGEPAHG